MRNGKPYNVGMKKAKAAARAVGGRGAALVFNEEEKAKGLTAFNDLHKTRGIGEVKRQMSREGGKEKGRVLER